MMHTYLVVAWINSYTYYMNYVQHNLYNSYLYPWILVITILNELKFIVQCSNWHAIDGKFNAVLLTR